MDVQTDTYLEELTDRVPETEIETQTDAFNDRPAAPLFIPCKTGFDAETQVDVDELFDFDSEVEPILEILVGKTLEHAMMEVLEEEESFAIRKHQEEFRQQRNIELSEVQRLEAQARRREEEKSRRIQQEEQRVVHEAQVLNKVAARAFASDYLEDLNATVFDKMMQSGQMFDPLIKEVEEHFLPWLVQGLQTNVGRRSEMVALTDSIIRSAIEQRAKFYFQQRQKQIESTRAEKRALELQKDQQEEKEALEQPEDEHEQGVQDLTV